MLSPRMTEALNRQINAELYSSYLYLAMAAYFQAVNLKGFSRWLKVQALEELYHGLKIYEFVEERGGRPVLGEVTQPPAEWETPLAAFESVLKHERHVSGLINDLVTLAQEERDHASVVFLQWFVIEQVEEEANASEIVEKLRLSGGQGAALLLLEQELGQRVFLIPPDVKIPVLSAGGGGAGEGG